MALFLLVLLGLVDFRLGQEVHLSQGVVYGVEKYSSIIKKSYVSFQGIPYAKPPVGELRFKDPQPLEAFPHPLKAEKEGSICTQVKGLGSNQTVGSEDCLFLNVYTPELNSNDSLKAVMVWIHGGAFITGSGNYDTYGPEYLLEKDVVVVTLNYRLGVFGFLNLYDPEIPGNMGLKDQVLALRWVKDNIAQFGGDPDRLTIFGESAGSASVHLLMLSPITKGLFQGVICESGSALNPWAFKKSVRGNTEVLAKAVGCNDLDPKVLAACLREMPADVLAPLSVSSVTSEDYERGIPLAFPPSLDGEFLPREPLEILTDGSFNKVPYLGGINNGEGILVLPDSLKPITGIDKINDEIERLVPADLNLRRGSQNSKKVALNIKDFYFDGKNITSENMDKLKDFFSDRFFLVGLDHTLALQAKMSDQPNYVYELMYESVLGFMKFALGMFSMKGVCHGDDIGYLWNVKANILQFLATDDNKRVRERMVTMWTNFAKTGNPTPQKSDLLPVTWRPYTADDPAYLRIEKELEVDTNFEEERMDFWRSIYKQY